MTNHLVCIGIGVFNFIRKNKPKNTDSKNYRYSEDMAKRLELIER